MNMNFNRVWKIERGNNYVRFFPNPGLRLKVWPGRYLCFSKHDGFAVKRVRFDGTVR